MNFNTILKNSELLRDLLESSGFFHQSPFMVDNPKAPGFDLEAIYRGQGNTDTFANSFLAQVANTELVSILVAPKCRQKIPQRIAQKAHQLPGRQEEFFVTSDPTAKELMDAPAVSYFVEFAPNPDEVKAQVEALRASGIKITVILALIIKESRVNSDYGAKLFAATAF